MSENKKNDNPPLDQLADDKDELGWDVEEHGRFKDYVADPPETELFFEGDV